MAHKFGDFQLLLLWNFRGAIRGIEDIATGEASVGEGFDTVAGVVLEAGGGALGARAMAGGVRGAGPKVKTPSKLNLLDDIALCRRRRSPAAAEDAIFDTALPPLDQAKNINFSWVEWYINYTASEKRQKSASISQCSFTRNSNTKLPC